MTREEFQELSKEDLIEYILKREGLYRQMADLHTDQEAVIKRYKTIFSEFIIGIQPFLPEEKKSVSGMMLTLLKSEK